MMGGGLGGLTPCAATTMQNQLGKVLVVSGGSGYNDLIEVTPSAIFVLPGMLGVLTISVRQWRYVTRRYDRSNARGTGSSSGTCLDAHSRNYPSTRYDASLT